MASKKISIPFSCLQKFLLSPLFPSKNFKTLKKSFAYPPPLLDVIARIFLKMTSSQLRIKQWDISPRHYVYRTLQTTKTNFEKTFFIKQTIIIHFNLLLVCLSMRPFVFAVFSYLILVFWDCILCYTHFGGSSLFLNYNTFRAIAHVSQCSAYSFLGKYLGKKLTL